MEKPASARLARARAAARTLEPERPLESAATGDLVESHAAGRAGTSFAIVGTMETGAEIVSLWPRWMDSAGTMLAMNAQVRTRCGTCGTLLRVELEDVVARFGPGHSLIDRLERCRMVGCVGSTFYLAARTYGREWTALLRDPALVTSFESAAPARATLR